MSSQAQIDANRANAQQSTGPVTAEGKAASSQNAAQHGLAGKSFFLLDDEIPEDFERIRLDFHFEHRPATFTEKALVLDMARSFWKILRAQRFQTETIDKDPTNVNDVMKWDRYENNARRAFHRALDQLRKLKADPSRQRTKMSAPGAALRAVLANLEPSLAFDETNPIWADNATGKALRNDLANEIERTLAQQASQKATPKPAAQPEKPAEVAA
ncbi:MAG: hypothetical protein JST16_12195 [Bdellovibrionales bacterium]|nr:hypothetical protein [Bdellovibrionales bacterium]